MMSSKSLLLTVDAIHLFLIIEPVDTGPKRLKIVPFQDVFEKLKENILIKEPPKLYPDSEQYVAGRFYKSKIPISGKDFIDMRLDNECTTDSGKYLLGKLRNAREGFYLLYAVSGAGKTRTIFDIAMNNDGIYVVYMECRTADDGSLIQLEPTKDRNFKDLLIQ
ncbi:hypothetical protein RhiirA4_524998 [Rhizophagus irregularis]|uniref:Crinkler family protein n=1 Tax=Rhizophagus irregularis TaxID=588596 RepID=A0A2I1FYP0_9GLOM|nr:hypothetical protein RhiirA4_524998 [Rhizophagus irregularis]